MFLLVFFFCRFFFSGKYVFFLLAEKAEIQRPKKKILVYKNQFKHKIVKEQVKKMTSRKELWYFPICK